MTQKTPQKKHPEDLPWITLNSEEEAQKWYDAFVFLYNITSMADRDNLTAYANDAVAGPLRNKRGIEPYWFGTPGRGNSPVRTKLRDFLRTHDALYAHLDEMVDV